MASQYLPPSTPLRRRNHDVFLSHAHVDHEAVVRLKRWLEETVGLKVWFDADKLAAGERFPSALARGLTDCRAMIVALSSSSLASHWVSEEREHGLAHQGSFREFAVIPVRLEECSLPVGLFATSAIDAFGGRMSGIEAARLLRGIHGMRDSSPPAEVHRQTVGQISRLAGDAPDAISSASMPVLFVSCGWRDGGNEQLVRQMVCRVFREEGFHLVADAEDQPRMQEDRIRSIMSGCSGQLVIVPRRADSFDDDAYKYLRAEVDLAQQVGLDQCFVAESGVRFPRSVTQVLTLETAGASSDQTKAEQLARDRANEMIRSFQVPAKPSYVFVATDYEDRSVRDHVVRHIAQVAGIPCLRGTDFDGRMPARKIELAIVNASLTIANIVSSTRADGSPEVNWNSCIEAGIAMGAGNRLHTIARRGMSDHWHIKDHLPFMLRDNTIHTYPDDQHLVGLAHRFARTLRRRVVGI